jgi:hypothetical protein
MRPAVAGRFGGTSPSAVRLRCHHGPVRKVPHDLPRQPPPSDRPRDSADKCSRQRLLPRLTVSLTAIEFIRVVALAERLGIPAAAVLRRAVAAYQFPTQHPQPNGGRDD